MAITESEILELTNRFHDVVMIEKGNVEAQASFFLYPEHRIYVPHGEDLSLQANYEIHQRLTDEVHIHGYDKELPLTPGKPASVKFTADMKGTFEIETHESDKLVAKLVVS